MELLPTVIFVAIAAAAITALAVLAVWPVRHKPINQTAPDRRGRRSTW